MLFQSNSSSNRRQTKCFMYFWAPVLNCAIDAQGKWKEARSSQVASSSNNQGITINIECWLNVSTIGTNLIEDKDWYFSSDVHPLAGFILLR